MPHFCHMSPIMRKPDFCLYENIGTDQLCSNCSVFVCAIQIVQFLVFLNLKFQASNHLLRLYRPVCVGPGRKPRRPVFLRRGSYYEAIHFLHSQSVTCKLTHKSHKWSRTADQYFCILKSTIPLILKSEISSYLCWKSQC